MEQDSQKLSKAARKRPPRVITEKRKEQNRIHQRNYREKKKRTQSEQAHSPPSDQGVCSTSFDCTNLEHNGMEFLFDWENTGYTDLGISLNDGPSSAQLLGVSETASDLPSLQDPELEKCFELQDYPDINVIPPLETKLVDLDSTEEPIESFDTGNSTTVGKFGIEDVIKAGLQALLKNKSSKGHASTPSDSGLNLSTVQGQPISDESCRALVQEFNRCISLQKLLTDSTYTPDIHSNHIRLERINLTAACLANAAMIGLEIELSPRQCDTPHTAMPSPFFRRGETIGDAAAVLASYSHVSRDLQPCTAQIEQPHDIYIDVIPFPGFRQRIMSIRAMGGPSLFDEEELCEDLDKNGLVCWGSRGSGTPWDMRSWEVKPWFMKKWWMLIGKDGDMYQQSKWYWDLQGESYD